MNIYNIRPFGPPLGKAQLEHNFIKKINDYVDNILLIDEDKRKKHDASTDLVGKVSEELYLEKEFIAQNIEKKISKLINSFLLTNNHTKQKSIEILKCWIVRQFESEYNPIHSHTGHVSGVLYLKVPQDRIAKKDGAISFINSTESFLNTGHMTVIPEVGDIYLFPSYLLHTVYPIRKNNSERRSMSFNTKVNY